MFRSYRDLEQAEHGFIVHIRGMSTGNCPSEFLDTEFQQAELEATGLRKHLFERPVHTFVKVSVDDQQVETSVSLDTLNPKWTEPILM